MRAEWGSHLAVSVQPDTGPWAALWFLSPALAWGRWCLPPAGRPLPQPRGLQGGVTTACGRAFSLPFHQYPHAQYCGSVMSGVAPGVPPADSGSRAVPALLPSQLAQEMCPLVPRGGRRQAPQVIGEGVSPGSRCLWCVLKSAPPVLEKSALQILFPAPLLALPKCG